jgi:hypothetical protein
MNVYIVIFDNSLSTLSDIINSGLSICHSVPLIRSQQLCIVSRSDTFLRKCVVLGALGALYEMG